VVAVACILFLLVGLSPAKAALPPSWSDTDIGAPAQPGSASATNGAWTVAGGGADIWGTTDQFNYVYEPFSGDGTLTALVSSQQNTDPWAKAGIMFRNDTSSGAMHVAVLATPGNGVSFQWRSSTGGPCNNQVAPGIAAPVYVKLVRNGNTFRGYYSLDGASWTQVGSDQAVGLNGQLLAGLAVTAHNNALLSTATFNDVTAAPAAAVLTWRNDSARTGQNTNEAVLNLTNVNSNTFGLLFNYPVDGQVYAQPLVMTNVSIPGKGVHRVVYVATEHDGVYAFDADGNGGANAALLWQVSFINPAAGITTVPSSEANQPNVAPEMGITSTPVIDPVTGTIYIEARTKEVSGGTTSYPHRLHALDLATGLERPNSPVVITATNYPGTGTPGYPDSDGAGHVVFNALREHSRPGLLLVNGAVYFAFASPGDNQPYHGWVFGYDEQTLAQKGVFNTTPNGAMGGIWMAGAGLSADAAGNVYLETGNGDFDPANANYGDSVLKLSSTSGLALADYFTPYNQDYLDLNDLDLGSGGTVVLPDSVGSLAHPHLIVCADKTSTIYLLDRDNLGRFNSLGDTQIVQFITGAVGGMWNTPAYFNGMLYYIGVGDRLKAFTIGNAAINPTPVAQGPTTIGYPGASPAISANGTGDAIVWALQEDGANGGQAVLHAYNAANVAQELYNSTQVAARDNPGGAIEFNVPTIANGKVYVGTANSLAIFGNAVFVPVPTISPNGGEYTTSVTVTLSDSLVGASIYYTLDGSAPTTNSLRYSVPLVLTNSAVLTAKAVARGAVDSPLASATFLNALNAPPFLTSIYPDGSVQFQPTNLLAFTLSSRAGITRLSVQLSATNLLGIGTSQLLTNGNGLTVSGPATSPSVAAPLLSNMTYSAVINAVDANGLFTTNVTFDTIIPTYTWEAEDYDYGGGQFVDNPQTNAYAGLVATLNVDAFNPNGGGGAYRPINTGGDTGGDLGTEVNGDRPRAEYVTGGRTDYDQGWNNGGSGLWANYTRHFPAGRWNILLRGAGWAAATQSAVLFQGGTNGTLLGQFAVPNTGAGQANMYQNYTWVPLVDTYGNPIEWDTDGTRQTLTMMTMQGNYNANFFLMVPAGTVPVRPVITQLYPNGSTLFQRTNLLSFVINSPVPLSPTNVTVTLNGVVLNNLVFSGSPTNLAVSWPYLKPNTAYSLTIAVNGNNVSSPPVTYNFDTFSSSYYTWEAEDWDYNSGHFIDNPQLNGYAGLPGMPGVDAINNSGGGTAYRSNDAGDLGNEVNGDVRRAQYINANASDYDLGWTAAGQWANYTRTYPKGLFNVYMRGASPNGAPDAASLWQVTSGLGTSNQNTVLLGEFNLPPTGGWQTYTWMPMVNLSGKLVTVTNSGAVTTLRMHEDNGGWNANFFMLAPIGFNLEVALSGGTVSIWFPTQVNATYQIQYKNHLSDSVWTPLASAVTGTGDFISVQGSFSGSTRFYRGVVSGAQ
jgi:hypothetical protein